MSTVSIFTPGQPVNIWFNREDADAYRLTGRVVENIDATCHPLTNYWLVELPTGARLWAHVMKARCPSEVLSHLGRVA